MSGQKLFKAQGSPVDFFLLCFSVFLIVIFCHVFLFTFFYFFFWWFGIPNERLMVCLTGGMVDKMVWYEGGICVVLEGFGPAAKCEIAFDGRPKRTRVFSKANGRLNQITGTPQ